MHKLDVAVLGATGAVGQRFIKLLENHPWFRLTEVIASDRSAGKRYGDVVHWVLDEEPPADVLDLIVKPLDGTFDSLLIFSALPKEAAYEREVELAAAGHVVCTNASAHRMDEDVPLLLPEINADHLGLIAVQRRKRGWTSGALIANSNCTAMPVVMSLAPLLQFGIRKVSVVSMQATSGAGYPGVPSLDIIDNVVPYIGGEEEKLVEEPQKMLGHFNGETVDTLDSIISPACNRVAVIDGHLVNISLELADQPSLEAMIDAWNSFRGPAPVPSLPSAPPQPMIYLPQQDRPQTRRDRNAGGGMSTTIGRLRPDPILGYKFIALSHNTVRGAAGGSILNAELLAAQGYLGNFRPVEAQAREALANA
ncbi:MAG: aspartate-semialdehyde dehydrogenase [Chloroflexota bacterium]